MNFDRNRRRFTATSLAVGAGMLLSSPLQVLAQGKKRRIAFANISDEVPFAATVLKGFKDIAAKRPDLEFGYFDNKFDAARSVENARNIATARYDAYINYGVSAAANTQIVRIMGEAGIPSLAITVPMQGSPLFAVDNVKAGTESGRRLAESAKAKWPGVMPVVIISGYPEISPTMAERNVAAKEGIRSVFSGIAIEEFSNKHDPALSRQIATDVLTRNPGKRIIVWCSLDSVALATVAAVRSAARESEVLIAATGGDMAAFTEIRRPNSNFVGTYAFFPELWAQDLVAVAEKLLNREKVPDRIIPQRQAFLERDTVAKYYPT